MYLLRFSPEPTPQQNLKRLSHYLPIMQNPYIPLIEQMKLNRFFEETQLIYREPESSNFESKQRVENVGDYCVDYVNVSDISNVVRIYNG